MAKHPRFEISRGKVGRHYFRLTAKNGQVILTSQGYSSKDGCRKGIDSVRSNAPQDANYARKVAANDQDYFNLLAANKQVIGTSEMYSSKAAMEKGIDSVKTNAPVAGISDEA